MDESVDLWETPAADEVYMLAGWRQWADAGSLSSALPEYLIEHLGARQIGEISPRGFYLFQLPGAQDLLRPHIKLEDGYRQELRKPNNRLYYWQNERKGLVIFLGDEPHLDADRYAAALFDVAQRMRVRRIASIGGVYAPVPYEKHRDMSCTYSLPSMQEELRQYGVSFSSYEGGVSIGSFLLDRAEEVQMEYLVLYAMVPYYDLSQLAPNLQGIGLEEDYRAWHDLMVRVNHMFGLGLDLSDLRRKGDSLVAAMEAKVAELESEMPQLGVRDFLSKLTADFEEKPFMPLVDVWEDELGDLFGDGDGEPKEE